eukprot:UN10722
MPDFRGYGSSGYQAPAVGYSGDTDLALMFTSALVLFCIISVICLAVSVFVGAGCYVFGKSTTGKAAADKRREYQEV